MVGPLDAAGGPGPRPPRIAHLSSRFPKVSETFILLEILELERLGHHVEVFSLVREPGGVLHPQAQRLAEAAHYGFPPTRRVLAAQLHWLRQATRRYARLWWDAVRGNASSPKFLLRALAVVPIAATWALETRELAIDVVHAHYATHPAIAAWVIHRLTGLPYTFTVHAHDLYVDRAMLGPKVDEARAVVTISEYNRRLIGRLQPQALRKVEVVRCGVELDQLEASPAAPHPGPLRILCVGSLEPYKGQRFLVEACARLRDAGLEIECRLLGEGEDREELEALTRSLGLEREVRLVGALPRERVAEELREADAFVLPSIVTATGKMEGLPVALMEALAARRPTVATAISGIPELIEDGVTGLLVPPGDAPALAEAILRLARDPDLGRRLGEAGRERVRAAHDLTANVRRLSEVLAGR